MTTTISISDVDIGTTIAVDDGTLAGLVLASQTMVKAVRWAACVDIVQWCHRTSGKPIAPALGPAW
jgi:hypothetical protein